MYLIAAGSAVSISSLSLLEGVVFIYLMFFAYIEQLKNTIFVSCIKNSACFDNGIKSVILEVINNKIKPIKYSGEYGFKTLEKFRERCY
ncbi:MAG: hypothetical protein V7K70_13570 [Nostoc sp.]